MCTYLAIFDVMFLQPGRKTRAAPPSCIKPRQLTIFIVMNIQLKLLNKFNQNLNAHLLILVKTSLVLQQTIQIIYQYKNI